MSRLRAATLVMAATVATHCGGSPTAPQSPGSPPGSGSLPVVQSIAVSRTHVDAGDEISVTATLSGLATSERVRYIWSVQPNGGALAGDGSLVRWRAPLEDPVPAAYVFSVSLVHASQALSSPSGATALQAAAVTSPPVIVNDARRELTAQSDAFFHDIADPAVAPETSVRNFADSCSGKQDALAGIAADREAYSSVSLSYELQIFLRSAEWENCIDEDGSARCALLLYDVTGTRTRRSDGVEEPVAGTEYVQGFYERDRWWLCGTRFEGK